MNGSGRQGTELLGCRRMHKVPFPSQLFDLPIFYHLFHKFVSGSKKEVLKAQLERKEGSPPFRVIDLGCGPGTNADMFRNKERYDYVGIDFNEAYIKQASQEFGLSFQVGDIARLPPLPHLYDIILINSVFHHLTEDQANATLKQVPDKLTAKGECLVMDMVYPTQRRLSNVLTRFLIRMDRGHHCREEEHLRALLQCYFNVVDPHIFHIKIAGIVFWEMRLYVCR